MQRFTLINFTQQGHAGARRAQALSSSFDWLKEWHDATPGELRNDARARIGADGIGLELLQPWDTSPFGQRIEQLTVPSWMLPADQGDVTDPPMMTDLENTESGLLFKVRGREFVQDRFGLAIATADQ